MFKKFPQLHQEGRRVLWSPSYYVGTAGHVSAEVIEKYIRDNKRNGRRSGVIHLLVKTIRMAMSSVEPVCVRRLGHELCSICI